MEIYIGIPCYGVARSIRGVIKRISSVSSDLHIIIVNDGSQDNLDEVIKTIDTSPFLSWHYHKHLKNKGYGGAQKTIFNVFQSLSKNKNDLLILVHGDGQTSEAEIIHFVEEAKKHPSIDVILGSRMLNPISTQLKAGRPLYKIASDYILTKIENRIYDLKLSTYASGYRSFTRRGIDKMDFSGTSDKHIFDTESLILFRFFNIKYKEIVVKVVKNDTGLSANNLKAYASNTIKLMFKYGYKWKTRGMRYLIINSDDYGYSPSINNGVSQGFKSGFISSSSIMPNADYFDDAITKAKNGSFLDKLGVHINITEGTPLGKNYKTITNKENKFLGISGLIIKSFRKKLDIKEISEEINLQIEKCLKAGILISHLDTHQWSQTIPEVSKSIIQACDKYNIRCIRSIKERIPLSLFVGVYLRSAFNSIIIFFLRSKHLKEVANSPIQSPDQYQGVFITGHSFYKSSLKHILKRLKPGTTELMCHISGSDYSDLKNKSYFNKGRYNELLALSSDDIKKIIVDNKIQVISYKDFANL